MEKQFFQGWLLFTFDDVGLVLIVADNSQQCGKSIKTKGHKDLGANSCV